MIDRISRGKKRNFPGINRVILKGGGEKIEKREERKNKKEKKKNNNYSSLSPSLHETLA